jgi:hypothetical protein
MADINHFVVAAIAAAEALLGATSDGDSSSESDSEASAVEPEPRKRRCTKNRNHETVARSPFNTKYLVPTLENTDPHSPDSIWNNASELGRKFRLRFRLPYKMFDYLTKRYGNDYDDRDEKNAFLVKKI